MRFAFVLLAAVTTTAHADEPTCSVHVVRAPEAVRAAIEARVGIEPSCTKLDVRVIETRDGYYVVASPPAGEIFEGTVRDAGLVGELVTSWARLPHGEPPSDDEDDDTTRAAPVVALAPPGEVPREAPPETNGHVRRGVRDFALGASLTDRGYGARVELDIFEKRGFTLGVAIGWARSEWAYGDATMPTAESPHAALTLRDLRAMVVGAKTFHSGVWGLRLQAGLGVLHTAYSGTVSPFPGFDGPIEEGSGTTRMAEAAALVSHDIGASWALSLGALLSYYGQTYDLTEEQTRVRFAPSRELDVAGVASLRCRL